MRPFVYIVRRESADSREEIDVFEGTATGWELATSWARLIGSQVEEESCLDVDTLEAMRRIYIESETDDFEPGEKNPDGRDDADYVEDNV
jgi:hypothetical protein